MEKPSCYLFNKIVISDYSKVRYINDTIPKRIRKILLEIGRIMFSYDEEFWRDDLRTS